MRYFVRALAIVLSLLLPRVAQAGPIEVRLGETDVVFGTAGASFAAPFDALYQDGLFLPGPGLGGFSGDVEFETLTLLSLTLTGDADRTDSHYLFGPGMLTLTARWSDGFGGLAQGTFVAPLLALTIDLCEQELSAADCGDIGGQSQGRASATFGPGTFDPLLASALGIGQSGEPLRFAWDIDIIGGDPSSAIRTAGSRAASQTLEIAVTVPEPSALSLLVLSGVAARWARLRRRA